MGVENRENFGDDPKFFIGVEVEHTPMYDKQTLFVIGKQNPKEILQRCLDNYNATVKLDDSSFKGTNSGVWCHQLHELMDRSKYTDWADYVGDKVID